MPIKHIEQSHKQKMIGEDMIAPITNSQTISMQSSSDSQINNNTQSTDSNSDSGNGSTSVGTTTDSKIATTSNGKDSLQLTENADVAKLSKKLEKAIDNSKLDIQFSIDQSTKKMILQILDKDTKQVIMQFPPDISLNIARSISNQ